MSNLFPLPYWAPALKRVPIPLQLLEEAYAGGDRSSQVALLQIRAAGQAPRFASLAAPLSLEGEDVSRTLSGRQGEGFRDLKNP
jgi:hypothetical protein